MPSPEVINLTLYDDETQPDPIRSNYDIFESLLPTAFPRVLDNLSEKEDSESKQELIV